MTREYQRDYRARRGRTETPEQRAQYRRNLQAKHLEIIRQAKDKPCADCGGSFPTCVMDFDHNGSVKSFSISKGIGRVSIVRLQNEIAKCEVVCANCHRIRTFR